jgi:serine/threonine protein kinase
MTEAEAALITYRLLSLVRYLHSNGIAHHNLRPEMIFFETDSNLYDLKIVDLLTFGEVSKVSGKPAIITDEEADLLEMFLNCCHCYTRSPELVTIGERDYGAKSDMWSVGVILYNMLTGIPPFYESTEYEIKNKIKIG